MKSADEVSEGSEEKENSGFYSDGNHDRAEQT